MKVNEEAKGYRKRVLEHIELLASPSDQMKYERDVPAADVPAELVCGFVDDLYHPKSKVFLNAFTEHELKSLAELYGMVCIASNAFSKMGCRSVAEVQKVAEWRSVMAFAKDLAVELKGNG
ncbi:MAG: hypothetical protein OES46_13245 [Gammaproteobacteria bacterium]|nr:hypothetical protein [Gammaproteobacteria bacterium]